jgi:uncharacterized protein
MPRVAAFLAADPPPTSRDINDAFWQACAAGQRRAAEHLLAKGADINWVPDYAKRTALDAAGSLDTRRDTFVSWLRDKGAKTTKS